MPTLRLEVVTAEREVFSGEVDSLIAPGVEGELGILPRHAPLVAMLQAGELRYRRADEETNLAIGGGFLEVANNRVIVLADSAERADEIDLARAQEAQERARTLLAQRTSGDRESFERAVAELRREQIRVRVARRSRRGDERRG
jgi:F-type H+-transporting ATPase subunit epsilon